MTPSIHVFVDHPDPLVSAGLVATLREQPDLQVSQHACDDAAPDVVVADYLRGLAALGHASPPSPGRRTGLPRVLVVTRCDSEWEIRHALERGVRGYLLLGCRLPELVEAVRVVHRGGRHLDALAAQRIADSLTREALTVRETDVLRLMAEGLGNKAIANRLDIALGTVKSHIKAILEKLESASRTEAAAVAERRGLLRQGLADVLA